MALLLEEIENGFRFLTAHQNVGRQGSVIFINDGHHKRTIASTPDNEEDRHAKQ